MTRTWFSAVFITVGPFALTGTPAWAQNPPPLSSTTPVNAEANGGASEGLGEIVVTAQRHGENIQDVPIAITAITPDQIRDQGIVDMQDVQLVTPGLTFTVNQNFDSYTSNAFGLNGGIGLTYKLSHFSGTKFYAEARFIHTFNSARSFSFGDQNLNGLNVFPQNSVNSNYLPVTFGIRF